MSFATPHAPSHPPTEAGSSPLLRRNDDDWSGYVPLGTRLHVSPTISGRCAVRWMLWKLDLNDLLADVRNCDAQKKNKHVQPPLDYIRPIVPATAGSNYVVSEGFPSYVYMYWRMEGLLSSYCPFMHT